MTKVRVALVGCGAWGTNILRELVAHPRACLVQVIDPSPDARSLAAAASPSSVMSSSLLELDRTVEAVMIASPGPLHAQHADFALRCGCHVFVEKPFALSVTDALGLTTLASSLGTTLMVGHLLRYHEGVQQLFRWVQQGRVGDVLRFEACRTSLASARDVDGSALWSLAPHDVSIWRALDSSPLLQLHAESLPDRSPLSALRVSALTSRGMQVNIEVARQHFSKTRLIRVVGSLATVVFDDLQFENKVVLTSKDETLAIAPHPKTTPLFAEVDAFLQSVLSGVPPLTGAMDGLDVVSILEAIEARTASIAGCPGRGDCLPDQAVRLA